MNQNASLVQSKFAGSTVQNGGLGDPKKEKAKNTDSDKLSFSDWTEQEWNEFENQLKKRTKGHKVALWGGGIIAAGILIYFLTKK